MEPVLSFLGWIMFLALIFYTIIYKKYSKNAHSVASRYSGNLEFSGDTELPKKVVAALKSAGFKHINYDAADETVYSRTRIGMCSWGEHIIIKFVRRGQITDMEFMSVCAFPFQIFDWGKNKRNYRRFMRELNKLTDCGGVQPLPIY